MVSRTKTRLSSLGFRLQRALRKITTAKPSLAIIAITIVALTIFLLGGGIYNILTKPPPVVPYGTGVLFFYPSIHEQVIHESLVVMLSYGLGIAGVFSIYQSTKYTYKPRQAYILLLTGIVLLLISYIYLENLLWLELTLR